MSERFNHRLRAGDNGALLGGVCSRLAVILGWNVWAIRAVLLVLLVAKPLWTIIAYAVIALLFGVADRGGRLFNTGAGATGREAGELKSPELADRKQRIDELEQRFREWERTLPRE